MQMAILLSPKPWKLRKKRLMRFKKSLDLMIIKCVRFLLAHVTPHAKSKEQYEKTVRMFIGEFELDNQNFQIN